MHKFVASAVVTVKACRREYRAVVGLILNSKTGTSTIGLAPVIDIDEYDSDTGAWIKLRLVSDFTFDLIYKALCDEYKRTHQQDLAFFSYVGD